MSKSDRSHEQYGTDRLNDLRYKNAGSVNSGLLVLITSTVDVREPLMIRAGKMNRVITGTFMGMARRALSSNRLCPTMHNGE